MVIHHYIFIYLGIKIISGLLVIYLFLLRGQPLLHKRKTGIYQRRPSFPPCFFFVINTTKALVFFFVCVCVFYFCCADNDAFANYLLNSIASVGLCCHIFSWIVARWRMENICVPSVCFEWIQSCKFIWQVFCCFCVSCTFGCSAKHVHMCSIQASRVCYFSICEISLHV